MADLGIGAAHDGPTPTVESLSAALETALAPETRARATAVAGMIRTDGATVAAKLLLDEISRRQVRSPGCWPTETELMPRREFIHSLARYRRCFVSSRTN